MHLAGLLAPREWSKILTVLAGAEPLVQAQVAPVQQRQFFLFESNRDADNLAARALSA